MSVLIINKCQISEELEALKNEPEQQETTAGETEVAATTAETEEKPDKKVAIQAITLIIFLYTQN